MRVCIDVSPAVHCRAGIGRYAKELTASLLSYDPKNQYVIFYNRPSYAKVPSPLDASPRIISRLSDKPWRMRVFLAHLAHVPQDGLFPCIDLFHATDNLIPCLTGLGKVFTLHDLAFRVCPETHTTLNRLFLSLMMPRFLNAADRIIADSESTKKDVMRFYGVSGKKVEVIYPGVSLSFQRVENRDRLKAVRRQYFLPERFILYVGTIEPRKNLPVLFEAFKAAQCPEVKLVVVGKKGWYYNKILERLKPLNIEKDVVFTGFVPDEDLPGLMSLAEVFAFPSIYEGFGFPVLEAMACGVPVISSNASSLPEITLDSAILLAPTDVRSWGQALKSVIGDPELKEEMRQRGYRRAGLFSWERTAVRTGRLYEEVYACRTGRAKPR